MPTIEELQAMPWHGDPYMLEVMTDIFAQLKPKRFIETGTHLGYTSLWVAKHYPELEIQTCEVNKDFYDRAVGACKDFPNIHISLENSDTFLSRIGDKMNDGLNLFWLDAHWGQYLPLRNECRLVRKLDKYIAVLDDFETKSPHFEGDFHEQDMVTPEVNFYVRLEYVDDLLGTRCLVPSYEPPNDHAKGYGIFLKGVEYENPLLKWEEVK